MDKITESILGEFSKDNGIGSLDEQDRFEHLTAYLAIRRHFSRALDLKDVVIGDGGDTGIDTIAIIVNGALITDVDQVQEMLDQNGYLEATFIFVQATRSGSFDGAKIANMGNGVEDFFRDVPKMVQNDDLKDAADIRKAIYDRAASFSRRPSCHLYYITTGKWTGDADLSARIDIEKTKLDRQRCSMWSALLLTGLMTFCVSTQERSTPSLALLLGRNSSCFQKSKE